uniref:Uncharacterized protein n=1 Tax=Siphoviridae sp. ctoMB99 TaxID=2826459 RepID=A0A8S5MZK6_9CAUD|nr:MAG TPA: hypothetical protein [Siphoviridae sp. ctoMB99]
MPCFFSPLGITCLRPFAGLHRISLCCYGHKWEW